MVSFLLSLFLLFLTFIILSIAWPLFLHLDPSFPYLFSLFFPPIPRFCAPSLHYLTLSLALGPYPSPFPFHPSVLHPLTTIRYSLLDPSLPISPFSLLNLSPLATIPLSLPNPLHPFGHPFPFTLYTHTSSRWS